MSYAKLLVNFVVSENDDFSRPGIIAEPTPGSSSLVSARSMGSRIVALSTGETIDFTHLGLAQAVMIINEDATNYITVGYTSVNASNNSLRIQPVGGTQLNMSIITDWDGISAITLTGNVASCVCRVYAIGSKT